MVASKFVSIPEGAIEGSHAAKPTTYNNVRVSIPEGAIEGKA